MLLIDHSLFEGLCLFLTPVNPAGSENIYKKVYSDIRHAKFECNLLGPQCMAVVEEAKQRFTLRPTGMVQENRLIYKIVSASCFEIMQCVLLSNVYSFAIM